MTSPSRSLRRLDFTAASSEKSFGGGTKTHGLVVFVTTHATWLAMTVHGEKGAGDVVVYVCISSSLAPCTRPSPPGPQAFSFFPPPFPPTFLSGTVVSRTVCIAPEGRSWTSTFLYLLLGQGSPFP